MESQQRKAYPSDVSDEEWAFVAPYLTLMTEDAPQRVYDLREVFNGLRYIAKAGSQWRLMPHDLPVVCGLGVRYRQTRVGPLSHHCRIVGWHTWCSGSPYDLPAIGSPSLVTT